MRINKPVPLCPTICCCPEIVLKEDKFIIRDDYKGEVVIPAKDIKSVVDKINEIISLPGTGLDNKR